MGVAMSFGSEGGSTDSSGHLSLTKRNEFIDHLIKLGAEGRGI